jgi:tetratricopeptide (TPR) repeat protein
MRKIIIILVCCTILLLLGYCGYRAYGLWKQGHWMTLARQYAEKKDSQNELLCLKQALQSNPRNVEACRMIANLASAAGSPSALTWREKVVELDPGSLNDRLALAQAAMLASDYNTASNALAGVNPADKKTANYLDVAGELATAGNNPAEAEADFAEASRMDPSNPVSQFSLAFVELHGTNALDMDEARVNLKRISINCTNTFVRGQARRELVYDALRNRDYNTALSYSKDLVQQPDAGFADRVVRLEVLRVAKNDEYNTALAACQREASTNITKLTQMTFYMMERNQSAQTLVWLQSLPASVQTNFPVAVFIVQCQLRQQQWSALQTGASKEDWGNMDFMRHAYIAYAMRQQGYNEPSKAEWALAVRDAGSRIDKLTTLVGTAAQWNWPDETQQLLWNIVNNFPQAQWAQDALEGILYRHGSTRPLMQLFSLQLNRNPSDLAAKNNLAMVAMLLHAQELNPYGLAQEVYQQDPTNSFYKCTYAFALHLQGKNADALKIMQQISPKALENSSTAGYYGVVLKASGDNTQAGIYLKRSVQGQLLPEERALFGQALADL